MLQLPEFRNCTATVTFLRTINDLFDILNSRNIKQISQYQTISKKPLCSDNKNNMFIKLQECRNYIAALRNLEGTPMIFTRKKTGFCGFITCIESLQMIYDEVCENTNILKYIPTYKFSQDHIELLFGCIRAHNGRNNNPTCRQFKSVMKKFLYTVK